MRREFRYGNHAREEHVRFARQASRRWKTPAEVTTGTKVIYSPFYISPKTRISDRRRREAGLMNIQEQRSVELDSALVGARWERKKERGKNRMVSEGGSCKKKDAWWRREIEDGRARKCSDVNAINLLGTLHFNIHPGDALPDLLPFLPAFSLTAFLALSLSLFFRPPYFFARPFV